MDSEMGNCDAGMIWFPLEGSRILSASSPEPWIVPLALKAKPSTVIARACVRPKMFSVAR